MASQLQSTPGTITTNDGENPAAVDWTNPGNVVSNNDTPATVFVDGGVITYELHAKNWGFTIPGGATINGVEGRVRVKVDNSGTLIRMFLIKAGAVVGVQELNENFGSTYAYYTYGTPSLLWGTTLTDSEVNNSGFGVMIQAEDNGGSANYDVDHIDLRVYYTEAVGGSRHLARRSTRFFRQRSYHDQLIQPVTPRLLLPTRKLFLPLGLAG